MGGDSLSWVAVALGVSRSIRGPARGPYFWPICTCRLVMRRESVCGLCGFRVGKLLRSVCAFICLTVIAILWLFSTRFCYYGCPCFGRIRGGLLDCGSLVFPDYWVCGFGWVRLTPSRVGSLPSILVPCCTLVPLHREVLSLRGPLAWMGRWVTRSCDGFPWGRSGWQWGGLLLSVVLAVG